MEVEPQDEALPDTRPNWDVNLMGFAQNAALRGNCRRAKVGAALVQDREVIATGYGGAPPGMSTCLEVGCDMENGHCVRTIHAEMNALTSAARRGQITKGATLYTTVSPCWWCFRTLYAAGVTRFVCHTRYWHRHEHIGRIEIILKKNPSITMEVWHEDGKPLDIVPAIWPALCKKCTHPQEDHKMRSVNFLGGCQMDGCLCLNEF